MRAEAEQQVYDRLNMKIGEFIELGLYNNTDSSWRNNVQKKRPKRLPRHFLEWLITFCETSLWERGGRL